MSELDLAESEGGCRLRLRVRAGASHDAILGVHAGALRVHVTAPPERGKANRKVCELLAERLDVAPSVLRLVAGTSRADKVVWVPLPAAAVRGKFSAAGRGKGGR